MSGPTPHQFASADDSYSVHTSSFEGPLDLLLQLAARRQIDLAQLDLAEVTSDFLAHLADLDELDLETSTRFVVVAATLMELKAVSLLPTTEREQLDDLLDQARDLLYARLLEYRAFRGSARELNTLLERNRGHHGRQASLEPRFRRVVAKQPIEIDMSRLARLAATLTAPKPKPTVDRSHVQQAWRTVRDAALELAALLRISDATPFSSVTVGRSRADRIVLFLAALEMYKHGMMSLEQPRLSDVLNIRLEHADPELISQLVPEGPPGVDLAMTRESGS